MQIDGAIMTLGNENNSTGSCMGNINAKGLKVKLRSHNFKCDISMNNGPISLKLVSIE